MRFAKSLDKRRTAGDPLVASSMPLPRSYRWLATGLSIAAAALSACDGPCDGAPTYPEGERFQLTVLEEPPTCYTDLNIGDTFELVAGSRMYSQEGCEYAAAEGPPTCPRTDLEFGECRGAHNLGVECDVTFPDCPEPGRLETWVTETPGKKGQSVNSTFAMRLVGECDTGCDVFVPVTIKWL
jgi:hypothetical protein